MARSPNPVQGQTIAHASVVVGLSLCAVVALLLAILGPNLAFDFRHAYLDAANAIVGGESPYPSPFSNTVLLDRAYVYPPTLALMLIPLTFVPTGVAIAIWMVVCLSTLGLALWLTGVRDPRLYAVVAMWGAQEILCR